MNKMLIACENLKQNSQILLNLATDNYLITAMRIILS